MTGGKKVTMGGEGKSTRAKKNDVNNPPSAATDVKCSAGIGYFQPPLVSTSLHEVYGEAWPSDGRRSHSIKVKAVFWLSPRKVFTSLKLYPFHELFRIPLVGWRHGPSRKKKNRKPPVIRLLAFIRIRKWKYLGGVGEESPFRTRNPRWAD
eukprot:TRINITY_DN16061_c0_g1_i1.p1 TRINITY_DN16061_c0_g1~~TRINITY_DN16061_c0_g1_i1.p1  ORF type:complete len:151 (-),score=9.71 TRINITY_DN16061_c0_g1_i1:174-626(-)